MPKHFKPGKRYRFSKNKWLADTGNSLIYQNNSCKKKMIDEIDGREVEVIFANGEIGFIGGVDVAIFPEYCEEMGEVREMRYSESVLEEARRQRLMKRYYEIQEEIDNHKHAIYLLEDELEQITEELEEFNECDRQSENIAWRQMKL